MKLRIAFVAVLAASLAIGFQAEAGLQEEALQAQQEMHNQEAQVNRDREGLTAPGTVDVSKVPIRDPSDIQPIDRERIGTIEFGQKIVPLPEAHKVRVELWIADVEDAGMNNPHLYAKFCKRDPRNVGASSACETFKSEIVNFQQGQHYVLNFELPMDEALNFIDLPYFEIGINWTMDTGFLQAIKVTALYDEGGESVRYWNPCLNRWLAFGEALDFGPDDTAFCAAIRTCDVVNSGTDDKVVLFLADELWAGDEVSAVKYPCDYAGHDDFERGSRATYGNFFNHLPDAMVGGSAEGEEDPRFKIQKEKDGDHGGWCLDAARVYWFHPGQSFRTNAAVPSQLFTGVLTENMWIEDDHLSTPWIEMTPLHHLPTDWEVLGSYR